MHTTRTFDLTTLWTFRLYGRECVSKHALLFLSVVEFFLLFFVYPVTQRSGGTFIDLCY